MDQPNDRQLVTSPPRGIVTARRGENLADILERVLDKGIVIAGDITISLATVELLSIKIRLLIASVDKAREMGINWWQHDPALTATAETRAPFAENAQLAEQRLERLERKLDALAPALERPRRRRPPRRLRRSRVRPGVRKPLETAPRTTAPRKDDDK